MIPLSPTPLPAGEVLLEGEGIELVACPPVVDKFKVTKFAGPSLVIPAGSAGIQGQGWQKQWEGVESSGHTTMSL